MTDPIVAQETLEGWTATLRGSPESARPSPAMWVLLLVPIGVVSGLIAASDGTAVGLGLSMLGPAAAALTAMAATFFQSTATTVQLSSHTLRLIREGGLGTEADMPLVDLLNFKVERGAGRYNQTMELWTRTGPVPIHAGAHPEEDLNALGQRMLAAAEALRDEQGDADVPQPLREMANTAKKKKKRRKKQKA